MSFLIGWPVPRRGAFSSLNDSANAFTSAIFMTIRMAWRNKAAMIATHRDRAPTESIDLGAGFLDDFRPPLQFVAYHDSQFVRRAANGDHALIGEAFFHSGSIEILNQPRFELLNNCFGRSRRCHHAVPCVD